MFNVYQSENCYWAVAGIRKVHGQPTSLAKHCQWNTREFVLRQTGKILNVSNFNVCSFGFLTKPILGEELETFSLFGTVTIAQMFKFQKCFHSSWSSNTIYVGSGPFNSKVPRFKFRLRESSLEDYA